MQRMLTVIAMLSCIAAASAQPATATDASSWPPVAGVLRHPRCMNCHPKGDFPRQGDDRHRHQQLVMRGVADSGVPTLQCAACHQTQNSADGKVPGAPKWHLAPLSMAWENLNDPQLCTALKDTAKNGGKSIEALVEHMVADPLVQWAWAPGARLSPTLPQADFHAAVRRWAAAGAPCPGGG